MSKANVAEVEDISSLGEIMDAVRTETVAGMLETQEPTAEEVGEAVEHQNPLYRRLTVSVLKSGVADAKLIARLAGHDDWRAVIDNALEAGMQARMEAIRSILGNGHLIVAKTE